MPCRLVEIRASCNARGDLAYHPWITPDKAADIIAVAPVPFGPTITREAADLIEASSIPRLTYDFCLGEHVIQLDMPQDRRVGQGFAISTTGQDRCFIEAEAIHMHLFDPVFQTVRNQLYRNRMVALECIAAATIINIILFVIAIEHIIDTVVDALETDRGAEMIALTGMIKDHIQDHLYPRFMQSLHHISEILHVAPLFMRKTIRGVWGKVTDRVVSPEVL